MQVLAVRLKASCTYAQPSPSAGQDQAGQEDVLLSAQDPLNHSAPGSRPLPGNEQLQMDHMTSKPSCSPPSKLTEHRRQRSAQQLAGSLSGQQSAPAQPCSNAALSPPLQQQQQLLQPEPSCRRDPRRPPPEPGGGVAVAAAPRLALQLLSSCHGMCTCHTAIARLSK